VRTIITNAGENDAPVACGHHPYLSPGSGQVDDCELQLDAGTRIVTNAERKLPIGREAVDGTAFDFRKPRRLGQLAIDSAFTDLSRDAQGRAWVRLRGADGCAVELWVDSGYDFIELFTGDTLAVDRRRRGLGTEPMTCAPNALRTGKGIARLRPGSSTSTAWGIQLAFTGPAAVS
jgi:aldose 1-epimerase